MKLKTIFFKVLFPKQSFRGSSLTTTAVKVCLKKIVEVHSIQRTDTVAVSRIVSVVDVTVVRINVEVLTIITRPQISIVTSIVELIVRWVNPFIPFSYSTKSIRKYFLSFEYCGNFEVFHNEWSIHIGSLVNSVEFTTLATPLDFSRHTFLPCKQLLARGFYFFCHTCKSFERNFS